jgi:hypothetical protein
MLPEETVTTIWSVVVFEFVLCFVMRTGRIYPVGCATTSELSSYSMKHGEATEVGKDMCFPT